MYSILARNYGKCPDLFAFGKADVDVETLVNMAKSDCRS